jgi:hypothetical protein
MGTTWVNLLASVIDWALRIAACASLAIIAFFIAWWWFG